MKRVSKYVNQTKVINDLSFTTISYSKGKLEIKADGFDGSLWCGTQTWKTKESGAIVTKRSSFHSESKRFKECFTKAEVITTDIITNPVDERVIGTVRDDIASMAWMVSSSVYATEKRHEQKMEEPIIWDEFNEELVNENLKYYLEEIDNNNENRQSMLSNSECKERLISEAHQNNFGTVEDYINWYYDMKNEELINSYYEIRGNSHEKCRFSYNVQDYYRRMNDRYGFEGVKKAFRELSKLYHTDLNNEEQWKMEAVIAWKDDAEQDYIENLKKMYNSAYDLNEATEGKGMLEEFIDIFFDEYDYKMAKRYGIIPDGDAIAA